MKTLRSALACLVAVGVAGCGSDGRDDETSTAFDSSYRPLPQSDVLLRGATVLTGTGERLDDADVLIVDGRIHAVGPDLDAPDDVERIDAGDNWITPGIIDVHSHLGVYPSPNLAAHADGNEATDPNTAEVWAEHSVWPQDPGFTRALAGGITAMQILPGSANLFGGRSVTVKNVPAETVMDMKFPGAPHGLKMACGENPKRVYGTRTKAPSTRMGNVAGYRAAWIAADDYRRQRDAFAEGDGEAPLRDLELETLAAVLDGEILVHNHCYRADEMAVMLELADEFGYRVAAFHHAVEAYKVPERLRDHGACAAMWADWWGFKIEAYDTVLENVAIVDAAGACAIVHSDSAIGIQRLNQEAAKAMAAGQRAGLDIDEAAAIRWITANPARSLGILDETGTLEVGKAADVVVWSGNPFSVYTQVERVFIDGALAYDRDNRARQPVSDFDLGNRIDNGGIR